MDSIFGAPRVAGARDLPSYAMPVVVTPRRQGRGRRVFGGAVLAAVAAVAGVAMGVTVLDDAKPEAERKPAVQIAARSQPAPVISQPVPQANVAVAPPINNTEPSDASTPVSEVAATLPRERLETVERASPVVQPRRYRLADERGRATACDGRRGSASFACLAAQLDGADRDLVEAYGSATDAGVPRNYLVGINRRWERARDRAQDDPAEALRSYEDLTDELWTARRRALRDDE
ncbi:hypothetical protein ACT009_02845 [Sphingomonas sp. Tas61C01]|uniref:hypothetical protein n=1 Tax=Sphingomonas sp. Tas61C01 TaxID=3458297 RepID=UPI00403E5E0E